MKHINQPPVVLTANGTTHVEASYPVDARSDGVEVHNSDATVMCFVKSGGASVVADTTCQFVPPLLSRTFRRNPDDTKISIVMEAASTAKIRATPTSAFGDKS